MKPRNIVLLAGLAIVAAILLTRWPLVGDDREPIPRASPTPQVATAPAATASVPAPTTAIASPAVAGYEAESFPATVSLDDGPPPLKLYRCAVYARLLGERRTGAEGAAFRSAAAELDTVVALLRDSRRSQPVPGSTDGAGASATQPDLPDPESVQAAERSRAAELGPRLEPWLEESYARCDQELAWAREVWGRIPSS